MKSYVYMYRGNVLKWQMKSFERCYERSISRYDRNIVQVWNIIEEKTGV